MRLKQFLERLVGGAVSGNTRNIVRLIERNAMAREHLCDFGAGDGSITRSILNGVTFPVVSAIELDPVHAETLSAEGFAVHGYDLNRPIPINNASFDVVVSNQVIEHLYDTDLFLAEIHRVLRPGGLAVISTENLASWHNVGALLFGWQPFSLTNVSALASGVGNPFALHRGENGWPFPLQHHRLFTTQTLRELMQLHGFTNIQLTGSGYYPFPASFGGVDVRHAHLIALSGVKPAVASEA